MSHRSRRIVTPAQYIANQRRVFAERRANDWRGKGALLDEVYDAMRGRAPLPIPTVIRFLSLGNERIAALIREFEANGWRVPKPSLREGYDLAIKDCVDARSVLLTYLDYLTKTVLEERTAGIGLRSAHAFRHQKESGRGIVVAHTSCGGEKVAHDAVCGVFDGEEKAKLRDAHVNRIIESIAAIVARMNNPYDRAVANAVAQAFLAQLVLGLEGMYRTIDPLMLDWGNREMELQWLPRELLKRNHALTRLFGGHLTRRQEPRSAKELQENVRIFARIMEEADITLTDHCAVAAFMSDSTRMPIGIHALFDLIPNMGFWVTANFGEVLRGQDLSGSAMASMRYAISHGGQGHVYGIGTEKGNRLIVLVDPEVSTLDSIKAALLRNDELKNLTNGGETIVLAKYDSRSHGIIFLE